MEKLQRSAPTSTLSLPQTVEFAREPLALEEPDFLSHLRRLCLTL